MSPVRLYRCTGAWGGRASSTQADGAEGGRRNLDRSAEHPAEAGPASDRTKRALGCEERSPTSYSDYAILFYAFEMKSKLGFSTRIKMLS
jgi:hypothetical protein